MIWPSLVPCPGNSHRTVLLSKCSLAYFLSLFTSNGGNIESSPPKPHTPSDKLYAGLEGKNKCSPCVKEARSYRTSDASSSIFCNSDNTLFDCSNVSLNQVNNNILSRTVNSSNTCAVDKDAITEFHTLRSEEVVHGTIVVNEPRPLAAADAVTVAALLSTAAWMFV